MDTILLINDSVTLTKVLTAHFSNAGYRVIAVKDVIGAYRAFICNDVDLILTDYILGSDESIDIIETLRAKQTVTSLPIVVFTAREDAATSKRLIDAGANLVLAKSRSTDDLVTKIGDLFRQVR